MNETPAVLFTREQIAVRVKELGAEITKSFHGNELTVVALMKSCLVFTADLIREVPLRMTCHFLRAAAHEESGAVTDIVYSTEIPFTGRDILLIEDIVDTGITLRFLLDQIQDRKPRSLKVCALLDKPSLRKVEVRPDWAAFQVEHSPDRFLVGYGLDRGEHYRGLPYIGTIARPLVDPAPSLKVDGSGM